MNNVIKSTNDIQGLIVPTLDLCTLKRQLHAKVRYLSSTRVPVDFVIELNKIPAALEELEKQLKKNKVSIWLFGPLRKKREIKYQELLEAKANINVYKMVLGVLASQHGVVIVDK
jgi:hypothetical protein